MIRSLFFVSLFIHVSLASLVPAEKWATLRGKSWEFYSSSPKTWKQQISSLQCGKFAL